MNYLLISIYLPGFRIPSIVVLVDSFKQTDEGLFLKFDDFNSLLVKDYSHFDYIESETESDEIELCNQMEKVQQYIESK